MGNNRIRGLYVHLKRSIQMITKQCNCHSYNVSITVCNIIRHCIMEKSKEFQGIIKISSIYTHGEVHFVHSLDIWPWNNLSLILLI